jgi:hypothetical protein
MNETLRRRRGHNFTPPKAVLNKIPALYATDGTPAEEKTIYVHYFGPAGDFYIAELDPETNEAFGYSRLAAYPDGAEWGYIDLIELEGAMTSATLRAPGRGPVVVLPLVAVERDCHWTVRKFGEIDK